MTIYILLKGENKFQKFKKRIIIFIKTKKYTININDLKKYITNETEFALFMIDFLENKNQVLPIFPTLIYKKEKMTLLNFIIIMIK